MAYFYVDTDMGCTIREAADIDQARKDAVREVGTMFFRSVREANDKDISHVGSMGGRLPFSLRRGISQ